MGHVTHLRVRSQKHVEGYIRSPGIFSLGENCVTGGGPGILRHFFLTASGRLLCQQFH